MTVSVTLPGAVAAAKADCCVVVIVPAWRSDSATETGSASSPIPPDSTVSVTVRPAMLGLPVPTTACTGSSAWRSTSASSWLAVNGTGVRLVASVLPGVTTKPVPVATADATAGWKFAP